MWKLLTAACLLLVAPASWAQDDTSNPFETQIEGHRELFRWIDLGDMRGIRTSIRAAAAEASGCVTGDCPDFDCPAANGTLARVAELHMRLSAMENALDYMRQLEVAHLRNLHEEANLAEEDAAYEREVLFWQGASITFGASLVQAALVIGDVQSLAQAGGPLTTASALDELYRDLLTYMQDLQSFRTNSTPRFQQDTDDLAAQIAFVTDLKSNTENLFNSAVEANNGEWDDASEQLAIIAGRQARSAALEFLAARQDEVARMVTNASRERAEANDFARRLRGLSLQRELAGQLSDEALALYTSLSNCVQHNCTLVPAPMPEAPRVLRPTGPDSPDNMARIDQDALEANSGRILELGLGLRPDWIRPQCGLPDDMSAGLTNPAQPALPGGGQYREDCQTMENVGICSIVTPDRREACNASAATAINACVALPEIGNSLAGLQPMSPAFTAAMTDFCVAQCDIVYGMDLHLDQQRDVALDQVAELDRAYRLRGGEPAPDVARDEDGDVSDESLEDAIRRLRNGAAARTRFYAYDPTGDAYATHAAVPAGHILIATYPGELTPEERAHVEALRSQLLDAQAAEYGPDWQASTAWGAEAAAFWRSYGDHQFLTCGGAELDVRRAQCEASCQAGGAAIYDACVQDAPDLSLDLGPALYPPDDPRGDAIEPFNAQAAMQRARMGED